MQIQTPGQMQSDYWVQAPAQTVMCYHLKHG